MPLSEKKPVLNLKLNFAQNCTFKKKCDGIWNSPTNPVCHDQEVRFTQMVPKNKLLKIGSYII